MKTYKKGFWKKEGNRIVVLFLQLLNFYESPHKNRAFKIKTRDPWISYTTKVGHRLFS